MKKCVFNDLLNKFTLFDPLMPAGREFHNFGAMVEKLRSPNLTVLVFVITSWMAFLILGFFLVDGSPVSLSSISAIFRSMICKYGLRS